MYGSPALPHLSPNNSQITSPPTSEYNCIGWAAGENDRWWWPAPFYYWPTGIAKDETVAAFAAAFATIGYSKCDNIELNPDLEKVILFVDNTGKPTHMARQLGSGLWTSKLGREFDINHETPEAVGGGLYGSVSIVLCRQRT